jgi:hypothetical protein
MKLTLSHFSSRPKMQYRPRSYRRLETLPAKKVKIGRPRLPKGEAKGCIIQVRFTADDIKAIAAQAKANNQTLSKWVRSRIHASLQH